VLRRKYDKPKIIQSSSNTNKQAPRQAPQPLLTESGEIESLCDVETRQLNDKKGQDISELQQSKDEGDDSDSIGSSSACTTVKMQSTLLQFGTCQSDNDRTPVTLEKVMEAIQNLNIKVDDIAKKHSSLAHLACEDSDTSKAIRRLKSAENIIQIAEATNLLEWFYDEDEETGILRCLPCFQLYMASRPNLANLTPLRAQRLLSSSSSGTFATGILLKKETTRLLIQGHNSRWYTQKNSCLEHLCLIGTGSNIHKKAMDEYKRNLQIEQRRSTAAMNIFRSVIADLKLGAAAQHVETLISLLASCSVNVGRIGHSRKNVKDILYCLEKTVNGRILKWLSTPLPSTMIPPHYWATIDKSTPSRTTNQATLIVARDENGIPNPIPVAAPPVYSEFDVASYEKMAEMLLKVIQDNFSTDLLARLCAVSADGPYQANGFRGKLLEKLGIEDNELALPVIWDAAHVLNLAVLDVKDSNTDSGQHFRRFIKRCNVFNTILANGKGFAFLQLTDSSARRPVSYACQRFASSSYEQWEKIEKSFASYWQAFDLLYPNRREDEEYQYMIAGSDFIMDLLAFLDTMKPVVDLMLRVQSLDTPVWKLKLWWPSIKALMAKASNEYPVSLPKLNKVMGSLKAGCTYNAVTLLPGWLITNVEGRGGNKTYTWSLRDDEDIENDHVQFAKDLMTAVENRVLSVTSSAFLSVLEVFDAQSLVNLQCGRMVEQEIEFQITAGEYDDYGVEQCKEVLFHDYII
jgi:hypothetical protein